MWILTLWIILVHFKRIKKFKNNLYKKFKKCCDMIKNKLFLLAQLHNKTCIMLSLLGTRQ